MYKYYGDVVLFLFFNERLSNLVIKNLRPIIKQRAQVIMNYKRVKFCCMSNIMTKTTTPFRYFFVHMLDKKDLYDNASSFITYYSRTLLHYRYT